VRPLLEFHDKHVNCDTTMEYVDYVPPKRSVPNRVIPMKRRITEVLSLDCVDQDVDLLDLTMLLQRHTCKPGGCLKQYGDRPVTCRFKMPKVKSNVTRPTFKRALLNGRPVCPWQITLEPKRINDQRISNHNIDQLRHWRANCDFSITYDYVRVQKYVTKYAAKGETRSGVFRSAFENVFSNAREDETNTRSALKSVMMKVLGERDVTLHEALHTLDGLRLWDANITVISTSLESSVLIQRNSETGSMEFKDSLVDTYA
jgi:hypothetical protein